MTLGRAIARLAVSMIATVGNYDYGFYLVLYQDGTIQMEVKLTGIVNTTALQPGEEPRYGTEIAPRLLAPFHQHYFNARLDFAVDGENNTHYEVVRRARPAGSDSLRSAVSPRATPTCLRVRGPARHQFGMKFGVSPIPGAKTAWGNP